MSGSHIRDNNIAEKAAFFGMWVICGILLLLSIINLRRGCQVYPEFEATMQRYTQLRWWTFLNCILQVICFIGYYLNSSLLVEMGWIIWVSTAIWCLTTLGVRTSQACYDLCQIEEQPIHSSRRSTKSRKDLLSKYICCCCCCGKCCLTNKKRQENSDKTIIRLIYTCWFISTFCNILGSIAAWKYNQMEIQYISFGIWRFLSGLSLMFTVWRLIRVRRLTITFLNRTYGNDDDDNDNDDNNGGLYPGNMKLETATAHVKVMTILACLIALLIITLFAASGQNFYILFAHRRSNLWNYTSIQGTVKIKTLDIVIFYFPLWTFVQAICLVYCWVPQRYLWSSFETLPYSVFNPGSSGYF